MINLPDDRVVIFWLVFQAGGLLMWMKSRAGFQQLILRARMAIQMSLIISQLNQEVRHLYILLYFLSVDYPWT